MDTTKVNIWIFVNEYLHDVMNLLSAIWSLLNSSLEFFRGYYDYYINDMTRHCYGMLSSLIVIFLLLLLISSLYRFRKKIKIKLLNKLEQLDKIRTMRQNKNKLDKIRQN